MEETKPEKSRLGSLLDPNRISRFMQWFLSGVLFVLGGILSVLLDVYYRPEYLFTVPETVFSPPPKVKSGVIRLERREDIPQDFKAEALLRVVKAAFNQRRKTLRNALRPLGIPSGLADHPLLDRRAEQLSSAEFLDLSRWEWGN